MMTPEEHKKRHEELHKSLDKLIADFIGHTEKFISSTTIFELFEWSLLIDILLIRPSFIPKVDGKS